MDRFPPPTHIDTHITLEQERPLSFHDRHTMFQLMPHEVAALHVASHVSDPTALKNSNALNDTSIFQVSMDNMTIHNAYQVLEPAYIKTYMEAINRRVKHLWLTLPTYPLPMVIHTINLVHEKYGQGIHVHLYDPNGYCSLHNGRIVLSMEGVDMFRHTCPHRFTLMTQCAPSAFVLPSS
jgi:hypothetical protein